METREMLDEGGIDCFGALLKRWKLIIIGTIVCGLVAAVYTLFMPNIFEASTILLVAPSQFKTELKPGTLSSGNYKRILESKGVLSDVLAKIREKYPDEFKDITVEGLLKNCRVEVETEGKGNSDSGAPLLILYARHEKPEYAKAISDLWAEEFMALENSLQKTRTEDTNRFITEQFSEARRKLGDAEQSVREFGDSAQIEQLTQQIETVSEQVQVIFRQLQTRTEDLEFEKQRLATLGNVITAVEVDGAWLGENPDGEFDISRMNEIQRSLATDLLNIAKRYKRTTEKLAELSSKADVETLRMQLDSLRSVLVNNSVRLQTVQARRKSFETAIEVLETQLKNMEPIITLKKSLPDETFWEQLLGESGAENIKRLSSMALTSEQMNPNYVSLYAQIVSLKGDFEKAVGEEKYLLEKTPQIEQQTRKLESELLVHQKVYAELETFQAEAKKQFESRYREYVTWLDERNSRRLSAADLADNIKVLEERHKKRKGQEQTLSADLREKRDSMEELRRGVEVARHAYEMFKNRVEEARVTSAQKTENVRLVSPAIVPGKKVLPQRSLISVVAAIMGFLMISFIAVVSEYRQQTAC